MSFRALLVLLGFSASAAAQPFVPAYNPVFDDGVIPSIYIDIDPSSLEAIYADVESDVEYPARFIFDNGSIRDTVDNVGFRLRGDTARYPPKKSYRISFNSFEAGRKFYGLEKLNVNSEHNDPSIIRSKLAWDLFSHLAVPASRANHVRLYVNGEVYGLYMNVEHVDEQFLSARFVNAGGNLYKCLYPADLVFRGMDASAYRPLDSERRPYDLTQGATDAEGYADLAHFIDVINNTPDDDFQEAVEAVLDVNGYLRVMAADVVLGNWDDYRYLKNNFYLYHNPETGRFHFIPYDLDNTFGVDFVGPDWGTRDVYEWGHPTEPRPLARRILAVPEFRDRYTFYVRRLLEGPARPVEAVRHADGIRSRIEEAAEADPFHRLQWEWGPDSFDRSYTEAIGGHVEYGLYPFITARANSGLAQLDAVDVAPILSGDRHRPVRPAATDPIRITVLVEDEERPAAVDLHYRSDDGFLHTIPMADDERDGYFSATIPALGRSTTLSYHISAEDAGGQVAGSAAQQIDVGHSGPPLFINEIMADNETAAADPSGVFSDWIEIYNGDPASVSLERYTLTDDLDNPGKWTLPDLTLPPGGFVVVWADGRPELGNLHAAFRLEKDGEEIGLFDPTGAPVSTFAFGQQTTDVSFGRDPDGSEKLGFLSRPTPAASNDGTAVPVEAFPLSRFAIRAYPHPLTGEFRVEVDLPGPGALTINLYDVTGRRTCRLAAGAHPAGPITISSDGCHPPSGLYLLRAVYRDGAASIPVVIVR